MLSPAGAPAGAAQQSPGHAGEPPRRAWGLLPWGLVIVCLGCAIYLGAQGSRSNTRIGELAAALAASSQRIEELGAERAAVAKARHQLEAEKTKLSAELDSAKTEKAAAQQALERARVDLLKELAEEVKRGEIFVELRGKDLVVDVSDKVLFDTGKAEINERGRQVLRQVAGTLRGMKDHVFQVSGHTDAARIISPEIQEIYPTNWELSAARATYVVRFLSEQCGVPGESLVAAGYGRYRPVAPNNTEEGKARNRRIEIAVLKEARGGEKTSPQ